MLFCLFKRRISCLERRRGSWNVNYGGTVDVKGERKFHNAYNMQRWFRECNENAIKLIIVDAGCE